MIPLDYCLSGGKNQSLSLDALTDLENSIMSQYHLSAQENIETDSCPSGKSPIFIYKLSDFCGGKQLVCILHLSHEEAHCKALGCIERYHFVEGLSLEFSDVTNEWKVPSDFNQFITSLVQLAC